MPYQVDYSQAVLNHLRDLIQGAKARDASLARQAVQAFKAIKHRLEIYPQFGEPLRDLHTAGETLYIGVVSPLVVRYIIDEERKLVFVAGRFHLLS